MDVSEFYKSKYRVDGLQVYCKGCEREYRNRGTGRKDTALRTGERMFWTPGCERVLDRFLAADDADAVIERFLDEDSE